MVPHLRTPILNCLCHVFWFYLFTDSEFSCFAMLTKPYPVSGPTPMPQVPNLHHVIQQSAYEVLGATLEA